jgi:bis(5'-nucleosidyl)-tetraphosphatase
MDPENIMEKAYGVVPFYRDKEGALLVCLVKSRNGNYWGFPKGHPKENESEQETALREFTEETGINTCTLLPAPVLFDLYSIGRQGKTAIKKVKYFIGLLGENAITELSPQNSSEISDAKILPVTDASKLLSFESLKKIIGEASSHI